MRPPPKQLLKQPGLWIAALTLILTQVLAACASPPLPQLPAVMLNQTPVDRVPPGPRALALASVDVLTSTTIITSTAQVSDLAWSQDGRWLAIGESYPYYRAHVWDTSTWELAFVTKKHSGNTSVAFSPDSQILASAGAVDLAVDFWGLPAGETVAALADGDRRLWINTLTFSPFGHVLIAGETSTLSLWDLDTRQPLESLSLAFDQIREVVVDPAGSRLAVAGCQAFDSSDAVCRQGAASLWDLTSGAPLWTWTADAETHQAVFNPDGSVLAVIDFNGTVAFLDTANGLPLGWQVHAPGGIADAVFSADGQLFITGNGDRSLTVWDPPTGRLLRKLADTAARVTELALSPTGELLAVGNLEGRVMVWQALP